MKILMGGSVAHFRLINNTIIIVALLTLRIAQNLQFCVCRFRNIFQKLTNLVSFVYLHKTITCVRTLVFVGMPFHH